MLKDAGVIVFRPSNWADAVDEVVDSVECQIGSGEQRQALTVNSCIKVRLDLQADKSPVVVKGPFFPRVVNPRYRIRGTNV
jgi:hypothetical protein